MTEHREKILSSRRGSNCIIWGIDNVIEEINLLRWSVSNTHLAEITKKSEGDFDVDSCTIRNRTNSNKYLEIKVITDYRRGNIMHKFSVELTLTDPSLEQQYHRMMAFLETTYDED